MDPITLIVSALTAGATAALQETAGTAIKDAYQGLTTLIKQKFKKDPKATAVLEGHAEDPETWQKPLEKSLQQTAAAQDKDILIAAQKLLELVQSQKSSPKYDVRIRGNVKGFIQGDHATVTMNFEESPQKRKPKKPSKKS
jgi:hypothetical protein